MAILPTMAPVVFSRATAQTQRPGPLWGTLKPPLPTNAWWANLVLAAGDQPVAPYPYLVGALAQVGDLTCTAMSRQLPAVMMLVPLDCPSVLCSSLKLPEVSRAGFLTC